MVISTPSTDHLRLLTRVARLHHERGVRQAEIATSLNMSQAWVSRLLKEAVERDIVRTVVVAPMGVHTELEEALQLRYGLRDVIGISSWSATLPAAVDVMKPKHVPVADRVVQIVGGLGSPEAAGAGFSGR